MLGEGRRGLCSRLGRLGSGRGAGQRALEGVPLFATQGGAGQEGMSSGVALGAGRETMGTVRSSSSSSWGETTPAEATPAPLAMTPGTTTRSSSSDPGWGLGINRRAPH